MDDLDKAASFGVDVAPRLSTSPLDGARHNAFAKQESSAVVGCPVWVSLVRAFASYRPFACTIGVAASRYAHRPTHATEMLLFVIAPIGLIGTGLLCMAWKSLLKLFDARTRQLR